MSEKQTAETAALRRERLDLGGIPAMVWGEPSSRGYLWVHGKMSCKEQAEDFARLAQEKGFQTLSFDLPRHGERARSPEPCDVWQGPADVRKAAQAAFARWEEVRLYACSLGAFFSLHALGEHRFPRCLFQSPVVEMEGLIGKMMGWFQVTPEQLEREGEIETPFETLSWRYCRYVQEHPITRWESPTAILYGGRDDLQDRAWIEAFARRFGCEVTVSEESEHPFMGEGDREIVARWLRENL